MPQLTPEEDAAMKRDHALKYHRIARALGGYDVWLPRVPVSAEVIRAALEAGDEHLNGAPELLGSYKAHPLSHQVWDRAAPEGRKVTCDAGPHRPNFQGQGGNPIQTWHLSRAEGVCLLKHVAKYHPKLGGQGLPFPDEEA
jgi:hypothetical protein